MPRGKRGFKTGKEVRKEKLEKLRKQKAEEAQTRLGHWMKKEKRGRYKERGGSLEGYCFHYDQGQCKLLLADMSKCQGICPNWKSFHWKMTKEYGQKKGLCTWYHLVKNRLIGKSDTTGHVQTTF